MAATFLHQSYIKILTRKLDRGESLANGITAAFFHYARLNNLADIKHRLLCGRSFPSSRFFGILRSFSRAPWITNGSIIIPNHLFSTPRRRVRMRF